MEAEVDETPFGLVGVSDASDVETRKDDSWVMKDGSGVRRDDSGSVKDGSGDGKKVVGGMMVGVKDSSKLKLPACGERFSSL